MSKFIKIIAFTLFINTPFAYGMETTPEDASTEDTPTLQADSFTSLPNEIIKHIIEYLYPAITDYCVINRNEHVVYDSDNKGLYNELNQLSEGKKALNQLTVSCNRFNLLDKPWMLANKTILNNLLFNLLNFSKSNGILNFSKNKGNDIISLCIQAGANVNCLDKWDETPLTWAIQDSFYEIIELLAKYRADVKQEGALVKAIGACYNKAYFHNPYDITKLLIEHGADVNQTDENGNTPLHACIIKNTYKIFDNRGEREIPLDADHWLTGSRAQEESLNMANYLIQHGAHIDQANRERETPLYKAVLNDRVEMVELLISHGADVNQTKSRVPLICKASKFGASTERVKIITLLIQHDADVDEAIKQVPRHRRGSIDINLLNEINAQVKQSKEKDSNLIENNDNDIASSSDSDGNDNTNIPLIPVIDPAQNNSDTHTQIKESKQNSTTLPDDYSSDDDSSSSSSESNNVPIIPPQQPHIPGSTHGDLQHDNGIFTTTLNSIRANPLVTFSGVVVVGGVCYWAYKKYQAYKAAHKETEHNEQKEDEEEITNQTVKQPITA